MDQGPIKKMEKVGRGNYSSSGCPACSRLEEHWSKVSLFCCKDPDHWGTTEGPSSKVLGNRPWWAREKEQNFF